MSKFGGYHSEWNLGSPGGWDYQRMSQELGRMSWAKIKMSTDLDIELDYDHPILNPIPPFADLLLRAHKNRWGSERPSIALVAEKDTLDKVGENIRFIEYLNKRGDVSAALCAPDELETNGKDIILKGKKITLVFLDFNNNVIIKLRKKYDLTALMEVIKRGMVVNPRGMEPIGAKGVFEIVTGEYREKLNESTVKRTPWTRRFFGRSTTGPDGEDIPDLIKWVNNNWERVVLKPEHGYSGHGIFIGIKDKNKDECIQHALNSKDYIAQQLVPVEMWTEEYPWLDKDEKKVYIERFQTDFRCFVTELGLMGFVTRFGGIPTNVGSGGGVQPTAILRSPIKLRDAVRRINDAILSLGYDRIKEIQDDIDIKSVRIGNVYLLGPIKTTLRPRIITEEQMEELRIYARNLWQDAVRLEEMWRSGNLDHVVELGEEEKAIAKSSPWKGTTALIASDGLFNFGSSLKDIT